jgi:hypothetical protein
VTKSVNVGFVINKVALGQVFIRGFRRSPVTIIPPWLCILIDNLGDEHQATLWLGFGDVVETPLR